MRCLAKDMTTGRVCREELVLEITEPNEEKRFPVFAMSCPLHGPTAKPKREKERR